MSPEIVWAHRTDIHGIVAHANMAGDTQESISARPANSKPPHSPSGSTRPYPGETDGLENCTGTQRVCIHTHRVGHSSKTPANTLESPDLPVKGAVSCTEEKGPETKQTCGTRTHTHAEQRGVRSGPSEGRGQRQPNNQHPSDCDNARRGPPKLR